ncbi:MAG: sialate O-acetylesterase [Kiritimatiellia bacterium]
MILQRDAAVPVWGTAAAGETVTVEFAGQKKTGTAAADGRWMVKLNALPASSESRDLLVSTGAETLKRSDVLVGEVWVASGQSNMGVPLNSAHNAADQLPRAEDPLLRFFRVPTRCAGEPQSDVSAKWEASTPTAAKGFSAVAWFFARDIRADQKCPVAVLQAPWGGTSIETWISLEGFQRDPPLAKPLEQWAAALAQHARVRADPRLESDFLADMKLWQAEVAPGYNKTVKDYNEAKAAGREVGPKPQPSRPEPVNPDPMVMPGPSRRPGTPTVNFNGMIAPLVPYAIRGVIWYQGENNGGAGLEYRALMPRLIEDWRARWNQEGKGKEFPFLYVQLPANGPDAKPVAERGWPWLREAQLMTLRAPNTGMAITLDVGNPADVHPAGKEPVGRRLALLARKLAYGENLAASGPLYRDFSLEPDGKVRVRFSETGGGLTLGQSPWYAPGVAPFPPDKLIGFFLAGEDRAWVEAEARIDGHDVIVSSAPVPKPVAVRYGWANSPRCNLYNQEGLPASPFRTDDWPMPGSKP